VRIRADVEDIQTTRTEKLLAVVLAAFLLLGGIWTYQKIDDVVRQHVPIPTSVPGAGPASQRLSAASARVAQAARQRQDALENLELLREAYRTALEAGKPAGRLERAYTAAQRRLAAVDRALAAARRAEAAARPAAQAELQSLGERQQNAYHRQQRDAFLSRLAFILVAIVAAYLLLARMRRQATRWFPLAGSGVVFATIMGFVLASDYVTDYFDPFEWGIALVAVLGIVATLLAYWALQRYVVRRLPQRRVRKRQCPFCGYPVRANVRCEGCGREVVAPCASCEEPRRVGTAHCGLCGATSA